MLREELRDNPSAMLCCLTLPSSMGRAEASSDSYTIAVMNVLKIDASIAMSFAMLTNFAII